MKHRKALLSEKELLVRDKVCKASKRASETYEQTLHGQEQSRTHMISINTYHLASTKGSALECCSFLIIFCHDSEAAQCLTDSVVYHLGEEGCLTACTFVAK